MDTVQNEFIFVRVDAVDAELGPRRWGKGSFKGQDASSGCGVDVGERGCRQGPAAKPGPSPSGLASCVCAGECWRNPTWCRTEGAL